ncbi:hypothetical protein DXG01_007732, partial [Tephrocybe rancida]
GCQEGRVLGLSSTKSYNATAVVQQGQRPVFAPFDNLAKVSSRPRNVLVADGLLRFGDLGVQGGAGVRSYPVVLWLCACGEWVGGESVLLERAMGPYRIGPSDSVTEYA